MIGEVCRSNVSMIERARRVPGSRSGGQYPVQARKLLIIQTRFHDVSRQLRIPIESSTIDVCEGSAGEVELLVSQNM